MSWMSTAKEAEDLDCLDSSSCGWELSKCNARQLSHQYYCGKHSIIIAVSLLPAMSEQFNLWESSQPVFSDDLYDFLWYSKKRVF